MTAIEERTGINIAEILARIDRAFDESKSEVELVARLGEATSSINPLKNTWMGLCETCNDVVEVVPYTYKNINGFACTVCRGHVDEAEYC